MSERKVRVGLNEALFRQVNEKAREVNTALATLSEVLVIACECADISCIQRVDIEPGHYRDVRKDPTLFIIRPGHEAPDTETVVRREQTFWVVRKDEGLAADIARATVGS